MRYNRSSIINQPKHAKYFRISTKKKKDQSGIVGNIEPIESAYDKSSALNNRTMRVERAIGKEGMTDGARIFGGWKPKIDRLS